MDPISATEVALEQTKSFLAGYSFFEWPDLSSCRRPNDEHIRKEVALSACDDALHRLLLAIARIVGVYSGRTDVLVALQYAKEDTLAFIRLVWNDQDRCSDVLKNISKVLKCETNPLVTASSIRRALDVSEQSPPCPVVLCTSPSFYDKCQQYPLSFFYDAATSRLFLQSSPKYAHPSVSSQILSQIAFLEQASQHPGASDMAAFNLPSDLMSVCDRAEDESALSRAYTHVPVVRLATDYLALRAQSKPDAIAVRCYKHINVEPAHFESLTYRALDDRANQFARWVRGMGLRDEEKVAVCMERNVFFHIALMGIIRAGGCYVPIDPELPAERKAFIAGDSEARFVLVHDTDSDAALFGSKALNVALPNVSSALEAESSSPVHFAQQDGLAYLLYTSGTTGTPKGCLLTNRGLSEAILALSSTPYNTTVGDDLAKGHYLAVASIAFDVHLAESFVPIILGIPLICAPRNELLEDLPSYIAALNISHLGIVPSLIEATMVAIQDGDKDTIPLRYIASGGEKMSDMILDKWADHPFIRLANFYGPSEVTIGCCARIMDRSTPKANIGHLFANVSGYIVDGNLNILPRGGIGELVVEGPLVGRGYHNRPDLTRKAFLSWPRKDMWSYKTGDLVRMMPGGTLEILGRIDTQIKLRGVRIESEGISSIVRGASPSSADFALDAATILGKHPSIGIEQLVSFIAWDSSVSIATRKSQAPHLAVPSSGLLTSIRKKCDAELARYMRPSHIVPLSWLPLSSNGKSDAKALAAFFKKIDVQQLGALMADRVEATKRPLSTTEERVFHLLKGHTNLSADIPYSPELNLFECGLDSIGIIRFTSDLSNIFHCKISASDVMQNPTLAGVASLAIPTTIPATEENLAPIDAFRAKWKAEIYSTYPEAWVADILPSFGLQDGVLSRSANDETLYVQHFIFSGKDGASSLGHRVAWEKAMERHQILRTVFHFASELIQVVLNPGTVRLPWEERRTPIRDEDEFVDWFYSSEALRINQEINESSSEKVPFRLAYYRGEEKRFLTLSIHHALYDALSLRALIEDVESALTGTHAPHPTPLPAILNQIANIDLTRAEAFWKQHFRSFSWPSANSLNPSKQLDGTDFQAAQFNASLTALKGLATSRKVTLQALLTCAFAKILSSRVYLSQDVCFGVIRSGRLLPVQGIETAVCPLVTVSPLRVDFSRETVLHDIQRDISAIVEMEHVPLSKVQNWVRPEQNVFDLLFSVSTKEKDKTTTWDSARSRPPEADYMLSCEVVLDVDHDRVTVHAVSKLAECPESMARDIIGMFEATAFDITSSEGQIIAHHPENLSPLSAQALKQYDPPALEAAQAQKPVDPQIRDSLKRLISQFLGVKEELVGDATSLPSLGVDSIKSVGLARLLKKNGHLIRPMDILKASSFQSLVALLSTDCHRPIITEATTSRAVFLKTLEGLHSLLPVNFPSAVQLSVVDNVEVYPVTSLQAGMLSQTIQSGGSLYLHAFVVRLNPHIDIVRLQKSWRTAAAALNILRTSFHFDVNAGAWVQVVHSQASDEWTETTFNSPEEFDQQLADHITFIRPQQDLDFGRPPVWFHLFHPTSHSGQSPRMALIVHHALYDGVSISKLFDYVQHLYEGSTSDIHPRLQFTDLLQDIVHQEVASIPYWLKVLQGYRPIYLPTRFEGGSPSFLTVARSVDLGRDRLLEFLQTSSVSLQCLGQAAWAKVIASISGLKDAVFGHVVSGRGLVDAENVIGPVLNTIPCRVTFDADQLNIGILRRIHGNNIEALAWQHVSLRAIQKHLQTTGLWDSLFVFQPLDSSTTQNNLWEFDTQEAWDLNLQYALTVEMVQTQGGFRVHIAGSAKCMNQSQLDSLSDLFEAYIVELVQQPAASSMADIKDMQSTFGTQYLDAIGTETAVTSHEVSNPLVLSLLESITKIPATELINSTPLVALGIDSITAIQLVAHFKRAGLRLTSNDVIGSRTIGDLTSRVTSSPAPPVLKVKEGSLPQISQAEQNAILSRMKLPIPACQAIIPCTPGTKWLIAAWQRSERTAYQHAFAYRIPKSLSSTVVKMAWQRLVQTVPFLRATIGSAVGNSEPRLVLFDGSVSRDAWREVDCGASESRGVIISTMQHFVSTPSPLTAPPTRAVLLRSPEDLHLIVYLHHFQYDAWSLSVLFEDFKFLCLDQQLRGVNSLDSFFHAAGRHEENLAQQQTYWTKVFPPSFSPELFPSLRGNYASSPKRVLYTARNAIQGARRLDMRAKASGVSLSSVFLASWAKTQAKQTSSSSATFMLWQAGRTDEAALVTAPCSNVVPLRVLGLGGTDLIRICQEIQADLWDRTTSITQSDLEDIHRFTGVKGPLCNVLVNIVKVPETRIASDPEWGPVDVPFYLPDVVPEEEMPTVDRIKTAEFVQNDLIIDFAVLPGEDSILVSINAADHILDEAQAQELVKAWSQTVLVLLSGN